VFWGVFSKFLGVKFGILKCCLCKRNDKYQVWWNEAMQEEEKPILTLGNIGCSPSTENTPEAILSTNTAD